MPVLAAAFVPSAPVLVPELAGAAAHELAGVRAAADAAVREIAGIGSPGTVVVVVGARTASGDGRLLPGDAGGTFQGWGADVRVGGNAELGGLPLALTVGAWLLDRADVPLARRAYQEVVPVGPTPPAPVGDVVLVVVGDGSATRTSKAPGAFHPEAQPYDRAVAAAIAAGSPAALAALDGPLAVAVKAGGGPAWRTAAAWWGDRPAGAARVDADEAPYGVGYLVGVWHAGEPATTGVSTA